MSSGGASSAHRETRCRQRAAHAGARFALARRLRGDRPSLTQFLREDLVDIVTLFQERWDDGPLIPNRHDPMVRTLIAVGRLVPSYSVLGHELSDGSIELLDIAIDFVGLAEPEDD